MSKPQQQPQARPSDRASDQPVVETGGHTASWLAAAALIASLEDPVAGAEAPFDPIDLGGPDGEPSADPSVTVASNGPSGSATFESLQSGNWADNASSAAGLPALRLLGDDEVLSLEDLSSDLAGAYMAATWRGDIVSAPATGHGAGPFQAASANDLIFLDSLAHARSGKAERGGGKGGGKNGGNGSGDGSGDGSSGPDAVSEYLSGDPGGYNILIDFKGSWTSTLQDAFTDAADLISDLILGDVTDVVFRGKLIDDIKITADLIDIDGVNGILGQAGPTAIRTADYLPAAGKMDFDGADADAYFALGLWDELVLHEMLHTIGFGSVWDYKGLVEGSGTSNPTFTGEQATLAYQSLFADADATGVPLEQDGGPGTVESHWDEDIFGAEIMTGYLDLAGNYLSEVTVASLSDLGYETAALAAVA